MTKCKSSKGRKSGSAKRPPNWPSKKFGRKSGKGRDNAPAKR